MMHPERPSISMEGIYPRSHILALPNFEAFQYILHVQVLGSRTVCTRSSKAQCGHNQRLVSCGPLVLRLKRHVQLNPAWELKDAACPNPLTLRGSEPPNAI